MAFLFGGALGAGKGTALACGALGPLGLAVGGVALVYTACKLVEHASKSGGNNKKVTIIHRQENGDLDSSEVADYLNLGAVGPYKSILRFKRPFSKGKDGDKGYVEADHIPPLDSLRRAREQPGFSHLHLINRPLYEMVMSLENDPRGLNLLTVQVSTHHHRDALSTGASRASRESRLVLARRIALGEVKIMLKQAMIIAHPYASQQIRSHAGMGNRAPRRLIMLSRDRTMDIYRNSFNEVIAYYLEKGIITWQESLELCQYVKNDGYLDPNSYEYQEILQVVRRFEEP